jgi:hypothetical protein
VETSCTKRILGWLNVANSDWAKRVEVSPNNKEGFDGVTRVTVPAPQHKYEKPPFPFVSEEMVYSGKSIEFTSGARREDKSDAPRPDLVSPFALMRLGKWMGLGAKKHGDRNWEKGLPFSSMLQAIWRHLLKWMMRWEDEDHLAAVLFNVQALMHFEDTKRMELDDLPRYGARDKEEASAK